MNAPWMIAVGVSALAFAIGLFSRRRSVFAISMLTLWGGVCYMLLFPFVGAARLAIEPVDAHTAEYLAVGQALALFRTEIEPAKWAVAGMSLAIVIISLAWMRRHEKDGTNNEK